MTQCAIVPAEPVAAEPVIRVPLGEACDDLLELFKKVTDGRSDQGRDHPVTAVLTLAAAATVAGMTGYRAITGWIADVPVEVLADLYMRAGAAPAPAPGKTTIWRVLTDTDADTLDAAIGTWLTTTLLTCMNASDETGDAPPLAHLRLDGKTVRGAKNDDGTQRHL
ncbi:transposase family protein, partial [Sphaerimonospora cavernae]